MLVLVRLYLGVMMVSIWSSTSVLRCMLLSDISSVSCVGVFGLMMVVVIVGWVSI